MTLKEKGLIEAMNEYGIKFLHEPGLLVRP